MSPDQEAFEHWGVDANAVQSASGHANGAWHVSHNPTKDWLHYERGLRMGKGGPA